MSSSESKVSGQTSVSLAASSRLLQDQRWPAQSIAVTVTAMSSTTTTVMTTVATTCPVGTPGATFHTAEVQAGITQVVPSTYAVTHGASHGTEGARPDSGTSGADHGTGGADHGTVQHSPSDQLTNGTSLRAEKQLPPGSLWAGSRAPLARNLALATITGATNTNPTPSVQRQGTEPPMLPDATPALDGMVPGIADEGRLPVFTDVQSRKGGDVSGWGDTAQNPTLTRGAGPSPTYQQPRLPADLQEEVQPHHSVSNLEVTDPTCRENIPRESVVQEPSIQGEEVVKTSSQQEPLNLDRTYLVQNLEERFERSQAEVRQLRAQLQAQAAAQATAQDLKAAVQEAAQTAAQTAVQAILAAQASLQAPADAATQTIPVRDPDEADSAQSMVSDRQTRVKWLDRPRRSSPFSSPEPRSLSREVPGYSGNRPGKQAKTTHGREPGWPKSKRKKRIPTESAVSGWSTVTQEHSSAAELSYYTGARATPSPVPNGQVPPGTGPPVPIGGAPQLPAQVAPPVGLQVAPPVPTLVMPPTPMPRVSPCMVPYGSSMPMTYPAINAGPAVAMSDDVGPTVPHEPVQVPVVSTMMSSQVPTATAPVATPVTPGTADSTHTMSVGKIPATSGETAKAQSFNKPIRLRDYAGTDEPWETYSVHFKMVRRMNQWSDLDALQNLCVRLKGEALAYYVTLPEDRREDLAFVLAAFARRFAAVQSCSAARLQLERLQQKSDQTLEDLAQEVRRLAQAAFPTHGSEALDAECVRAFLHAVGDKQLAVTVAASTPKNITKALEQATEYHDASQYFGPNKPKDVCQVLSEILDPEGSLDDEGLINKLRNVVAGNGPDPGRFDSNGPNQQSQAVYNNQNQSSKQCQVPPPPARKSSRPCLLCGQDGHWAQQCLRHPNNWPDSFQSLWEQNERVGCHLPPSNQCPPTTLDQWPANQCLVATA